MTPIQFRNRLAQLRLTQRGCSRLLKVNDRTVRRWADDRDLRCPIPQAVAYLLGLMVLLRVGPEDLERLVRD